jgi:hypothetical protein
LRGFVLHNRGVYGYNTLMARPIKHDGGTEQITARVPKDLKDKVFREIDERPGISISDVVIEALMLHGTKTVILPEILQRRAVKHAADAGITFDELVTVALRSLLDGPSTPAVRIGQPKVTRLENQVPVVQAADAPFGRSVADFLAAARPAIPTYQEPDPNWPTDEPEEPKAYWSDFLAKCKAAGDDGANMFAEEMQAYQIRRLPQGFMSWADRKQADWLDEHHPRRS